LKLAILDDYAGVALSSAEWHTLEGVADIVVFREHMPLDQAVTRLAGFDVLCAMRERMPLSAELFAALPKLKLVTIVGKSLANLDIAAATANGVALVHPAEDLNEPQRDRFVHATPELAWGLVLSVARNIPIEDRNLRRGGWQSRTGMMLAGHTLGLLGLGNTGRIVARYGQAFGMKVIAWSQNLSVERATAAGVAAVDRASLFADSDILSIHLQLSERTRHLVGAKEIALMKRDAILVNTSRGAIVDEAALVAALEEGRLGGAGLDVFETEPIPADHPLLRLPKVTLTPHVGYSTPQILASFYRDMPEAIVAYARDAPIRVLNPIALKHPKHARKCR